MMKKLLIPILLSASFLIVGILTLADYGMNWDAPIHMMRGQAFAHFYLTGQQTFNLPTNYSPNIIKPGEIASRYYFIPMEYIKPIGVLPERVLLKSNFEVVQKQNRGLSFYQSEIWNGEFWLKNDTAHLPLVNILAAFSNNFFWGVLGWFGDIESYQLIYILLSSLGVFLTALFAYEISGSWLTSIVAGLSLSLFPIFFAESHVNMKDPEQAVFFMGAIWAFWHWVKGDRLGRLGLLGWFGIFIAFVALALAVKWNIVFLPLILIPWLILIKFKDWFKLGVLGLLGGLGIIIFLIAIWPYAWDKPLESLLGLFNYYLDLGSRESLFRLQSFVPLLLLFQTPEIILALVIVGVVGVVREGGGRLKVGYLLILWILVTVARTATPTTWYYGEIRQIMEVIPAMALLAGVGAGYLVRVVGEVRGRNIIVITIIIIITVILLFPLVKLHPNQNAYFNILVGGLKGAKEKGFTDWGITYGNIYKQGVEWLNEHAQKDADLAHLRGADFAISPLWLRDDISISPYHFSGFEQKGEYILSLHDSVNPAVFAHRYPRRFLQPISEIEVDGVSLLTIYQNDPAFSLIDLSGEKELRAIKMELKSDNEGDFWQIDLGRQLGITRLILQNADPKCVEGMESNEFIIFSDSQNPYVVNEKQVVDLSADRQGGKVVYFFPKEDARYISVYPQNQNSCFNKQQIVSIKYLDI